MLARTREAVAARRVDSPAVRAARERAERARERAKAGILLLAWLAAATVVAILVAPAWAAACAAGIALAGAFLAGRARRDANAAKREVRALRRARA